LNIFYESQCFEIVLQVIHSLWFGVVLILIDVEFHAFDTAIFLVPVWTFGNELGKVSQTHAGFDILLQESF